MADDITTVLRFVGEARSAEAVIESLNASLERLRDTARDAFAGLAQVQERQVEASERSAGATRSLANEQQRAADAALRHEQAFARLLQAQGKSEDAIKVLQKALEGFTGSQIQAVRAQIQLTNLQNDYANSPLITAVRSQTAALQQFGAANLNVEQILKGTARASQQVGDSLADSTSATIAQAQAIAQIQTLSGDAAGATNTLAVGLKAVADQQREAIANTERFTAKVASGLQAGAAILNVISAGFNFFTAIQKESVGGLTEAEAAARVVSKAFAGAKAAAEAVKATFSESIPVIRQYGAEAKAAAEQVAAARTGGAETGEAFLARIRAANDAIVRSSQQAAASESAQAFLDKIRAANAAIVKAGHEAGKSFADGVRSGAESAEKAGETLGKSVEEGVRKSLEQRSPSRVLLRLGREAAESFAAGFEKGKEKLKAITAGDLVDTTQVRAATVATGGLVTALGLVAASVAAIAAASAVALPFLIKIGQAGIEANSQLEQAKIGIATVVASVGNLNRNGIKLEGVDALNAALPIARKQLDQIRIDALQTALTFEQIAPAFLQAVGPGLAAGLNLDQIRKTVIDLSQLIVPLTGNAAQLGQELRAIFSGDLGPDAQVAKALQITRQEIEAAKEAGTLADLLNKKLAAAAATGRLMANTFEAATSNLKEAGAVLAGTVTQGLFDQLKDQINKLLPQIFDTASGRIQIGPEFAGLANTLTEIFDRAGAAIADVIALTIDGIKGLSAFLADNEAQINRIINALDVTARTIGSLFVNVGAFIAEATAQLILFGAQIAPVVVGLTTLTGLMLAFGPGSTAVATALAVLSKGFVALTASLAAARTALVATSTFLLTTPAGWAILAASVAAAGLAYLAFADRAEDAANRAARIRIDDVGAQVERLDALRQQLAEAERLTGSQANLNAEQDRFSAILGSLPPKQQEFIKGLGDQKEKVEALTTALKGNIQEQENTARAQQIILTAGIAARQAEIDKTREQIAALDAELKRRRELAALGNKATREDVFADPEGATIIRNLAEEERNLALQREASNETLKERQKLQQDDIDKLNLTAKALNQTEQALLDARRAGGLTSDQFDALKRALDNARASGRGIGQAIDDISAALGGAKTAAERAKIALDDFFASGDTGGLRKRVTDTLNRITADTVKAGGTAGDALKELNQRIKENKEGIADTVRTLTAAEKIQKALNDRINPPTRSGGARRAAAARAEASAELKTLQILEKERELATRRESEQLKRSFDDRLLGIAEYTNRAIALDQALLKARLATLKEEEGAAVRSAKNKADAEAKRREVQLRANQAILDSELRQEELRRQRREAERRAEEEHAAALREIAEIQRRAEEAGVRDAVNEGRLGAVAGEERLLELERERFAERKLLLTEQFLLAGSNLEQQRKVNDELAKLAAERAAFEVEASGRIRDAQRNEAQEFREFIQDRIQGLINLRKAEIDAQAAQTALALQRRQISPLQAEQQEFDRRIQLLRIETAERKRQIEAEAESLRVKARRAGVLALAEVEIERQKNAALKAERDRAAAKEQALKEQQRAAQIAPEVGEDAALAIAGIESTLGRELTLFERLRVEAAITAQSLQQSLEPIGAVFVKMKDAIVDSLASTIAAFVAGKASIRQAAAALYAAALQPLKDFLIKKARTEFALALADAAIGNFAGAAKHAAAGVALSAAAGLIDAGGAAIAGGSGGGAVGNAISSGGAGSTAQAGPRVIEQDSGPRSQQPQPIVIRIRAETEEGVIVRRVLDDFRNDGQTRQVLRRDLLREG